MADLTSYLLDTELKAGRLYGIRGTGRVIGGASASTVRSKAVPRTDDGIYCGAPTPASVSSQAGLRAADGPKSAAPSSPPPGAPGPRFR